MSRMARHMLSEATGYDDDDDDDNWDPSGESSDELIDWGVNRGLQGRSYDLEDELEESQMEIDSDNEVLLIVDKRDPRVVPKPKQRAKIPIEPHEHVLVDAVVLKNERCKTCGELIEADAMTCSICHWDWIVHSRDNVACERLSREKRLERMIEGLPDLTDKLGSFEPASSTGGYGEVTKARLRDTANKRCTEVAIKTMKRRPDLPKSEAKDLLRKLLVREIIAWKSVRHPYVLPLLGTYSGYGEMPSLVSPWCELGTITEHLYRLYEHPSMSDMHQHIYIHKLDMLDQALEGICYLHSNIIAHSDIKPANILVQRGEDNKPFIQLADFGLAKNDDLSMFELQYTSGSLTSGGTVDYMSPEVAGQKVSSAPDPMTALMPNDVWAMGCVCAEVLTHVRPHAHRGLHGAILRLHLAKCCEDAGLDCMPFTARTDYAARECSSERLWELFVSCWERDAEQRPDSRQLLETYREIRKDEGINVMPPPVEREEMSDEEKCVWGIGSIVEEPDGRMFWRPS
ncbi:kinase-like protein [Exidia glandulosa HHB12029]|uniref:Kinase-like protein n=1 Tax=Exidia glandulosa HHB12029 TaxID=1314781 RepID=A0A165GZM3_EXIGL|nr:kinase-like protein [Exidia glandulosa HHB12029]